MPGRVWGALDSSLGGVYTRLGVSGELSGGYLEVLRGFMGSPGTFLRALGSILGCLWAFLEDFIRRLARGFV